MEKIYPNLNRGNPGNKGGGRKPKLANVLKRLAIEKAEAEAEKSLEFCRKIRDNEVTATAVQLEAAKTLMDRIWGKCRQPMEHSGPDGSPLVVNVTIGIQGAL